MLSKAIGDSGPCVVLSLRSGSHTGALICSGSQAVPMRSWLTEGDLNLPPLLQSAFFVLSRLLRTFQNSLQILKSLSLPKLEVCSGLPQSSTNILSQVSNLLCRCWGNSLKREDKYLEIQLVIYTEAPGFVFLEKPMSAEHH